MKCKMKWKSKWSQSEEIEQSRNVCRCIQVNTSVLLVKVLPHVCDYPPFPFGRISFVVLVMRKGGESSWSGPWIPVEIESRLTGCKSASLVNSLYRVCQKSIPLMNSANFSWTIERYDITFYTLVTHSIEGLHERTEYISQLWNWESHS